MDKKLVPPVWVAIAALLLIILVYLYYDSQLEAMEQSVLQSPPS